MGRHAPCLASLVFPRAELSGRICLGFRNAITRDLPADDTADGGLRLAGQNQVAARFSKVIRSGRWVAGRHTRLTAGFGALFAKRAIYGRGDPADADGPLIRIVGDARFAKVAVHRGRFDPAAPWQHWMQQEAAAR